MVERYRVGESVLMCSPHTGDKIPVQYRGRTGDSACVVVDGYQRMVPHSWIEQATKENSSKSKRDKPLKDGVMPQQNVELTSEDCAKIAEYLHRLSRSYTSNPESRYMHEEVDEENALKCEELAIIFEESSSGLLWPKPRGGKQ